MHQYKTIRIGLHPLYRSNKSVPSTDDAGSLQSSSSSKLVVLVSLFKSKSSTPSNKHSNPFSATHKQQENRKSEIQVDTRYNSNATTVRTVLILQELFNLLLDVPILVACKLLYVLIVLADRQTPIVPHGATIQQVVPHGGRTQLVVIVLLIDPQSTGRQLDIVDREDMFLQGRNIGSSSSSCFCVC